ncbi:MAG: indolepyruvate/phenylpyruvate decarboxylase [Burkholderiaceae bacterium]|nr:indolepyruvate/phenylpyruvate decarboxylase [Burkholderiaceae bacterium]
MNLSEVLLDALKSHGARQIFGIPGDFALPFFRIAEQSHILPLYTLSHEPAVGFAADAAARVNSTLGVAAVTYGAGALNMVNPVAAAYAEKSPVVVISGAPGAAEANRGLLLHHQGRRLDSQLRIYSEITCDQACLNDARSAPADIARVLHSALTHSQPVYLELPRDMVAVPCAQVVAATPSEPDTEALAACAQEILERVRVAASPVIMVGVEVRRFGLEAKVAELATRLGVPVVTSLSGRGLLADAASPLCGTYLGVAGTPEVTRLVEESDALLLLGVIVSDTNFGVSARHIDLRRTIQALDERVTLGYHVYPGLPLAALIDALLARASAPRRLLLLAPPAYPRGFVADDAPIAPTDIAVAVNDLMDSVGRFPIAADMGDCLFTAMDIENTALVAPAYYATMGFGVPAGLGLQAATGERPLVLVGDGAFQMTGMELGNCRRYGWDPIVVVFNNSSWETLRAFEPNCAFHDRGDWRFADMAQALGGDGVRVRTRRQLFDALRSAVATRGRFQLIDAVIPRGVISRTLRRFVDKMGRPNASS